MWFPTWLGTFSFLFIFGGSVALWWFKGEAFLSLTQREPAEVLVIEGWIDTEGVLAAAEEFRTHDYQYVVATGGLTGRSWSSRRWSYAEETALVLLRDKIPVDRVVRAPSINVESQRTYEMAAATLRALADKGIKPAAINIFTRGAHARRSRLVFAKVFGSETQVGSIAWAPPGYEAEPWWRSSERADDLLKETVGYGFERLLNSGRMAADPKVATAPNPKP
ncbi:MAG: hypothetical protein JWM32_551 [Verrucomicrobia bacterium]|nr:hypothetical protein [Verrucomicrobiota bacterium]